MSKANIDIFIDRICDDKARLQELKEKGNPYSKFDKYSYAEKILAPMAYQMGVPFFVEEWIDWKEDLLAGILEEVEQRNSRN